MPRPSVEAFRLSVSCPDLADEPLIVNCQSGAQTVKWLGTTTSQRLQGSKPRGQQRRREAGGTKSNRRRQRTVQSGGSCHVSHVTDSEGRVLDPHAVLNEVLQPGDEAVVHMQVRAQPRPLAVLHPRVAPAR
jgi:hypothetical protein